jgi:HAE1 family hydrophobic/amphiphilic exporter-1
MVSMLVALTLTPMLCARYLRLERPSGRLWEGVESAYQRLERHYARTLAWGLRHRLAVLTLAIAAVAGGVGIAASVPIAFVNADDRSEFNVWLERPLGSNLEQTQEAVAAVEASLRALPETRTTFATIGHGAKRRPNEAQIYVQLVHKRERRRSQQEVMADVRERIGALGLPLAEFSVEELGMIQVGGSRNAELMYAFRGPNVDRLHYYAGTLMEHLRRAGGYSDLWLSYRTGKPEIALEIQRERAADLGVPALQIGRTIAALYAGYDATTFEEDGERYDVRVQLLPEYRDELAKLDLVRVRASSGALVPLRNLVAPRVGSGPVQIDREGRGRSIVLYANLGGKAAGDADLEVARIVRQMQLEPGYSFDAVGPSRRLRESFEAVVFAFGLALVAIYMILAAQFDSFVHPFVIMLSAPLSFIGAFAAVKLLGFSLDVMGQIAFLMLMGVVMKNGILLVDYINTLRERGRGLFEAVREAGPVRLRPVLMTAVSTILGMLPVACGQGDGSEWRRPMGVISIGGLATSTLLTLLVVPVFYTFVAQAHDVLANAARRLAAAFRSRSGRAPQPEQAPGAQVTELTRERKKAKAAER